MSYWGGALTLINVPEGSTFARLLSFGSDDASLQGHLNVRAKVLDMIFANDLGHFFFGFGLGQTEHHLHVSSAHSTYFIQLFEQVLFGVIALVSIYIIMVSKAWRNYKSNPNKEFLGLFVIFVYLSVIHLAYDALSMTILYACNGLVWGCINYLQKRAAT